MVGYEILCHRTAKRELENLPPKDKERLIEALEDVAEWEQPTMNERVKPLEGQRGMFRVRVGDVRAICSLQKPNLLVLKCGKRKHVYDDVDVIHERVEAV